MQKKIKPAMIFQNNMVLQRGKPIPIWGTCEEDQEIEVSLSGQKATTRSTDGKWEVCLPAMEATECTELQIQSQDENVLIENVAIGEVWMASGQSNMEFYLRYDKERQKAVENLNIRMFDYPKVSYIGQLEDYDYSNFGFWRTFTEENMDYFSAVAYYFASKLQESQKVPIGIVGCTWGCTPACAWMDSAYLAENEGRSWLEEYEQVLAKLDMDAYEENFSKNPDNYKGKPFENPFLEKMMYGMTMEELMTYVQEQAQAGVQNVVPMEGPKSEKRPGGLYETMIKQVAPYAVRGILWYQGENDDKRPDIYHVVLQNLIQCFRDLWQESLPFLFVQLAPFRYWSEEGRHIFPLLRKEQEWVRNHTPQCYMASIMDAGMAGDIHPKYKRPAGERLALLARGHVYGEDLLCDPPECSDMQLEEGKIILRFIHTDAGLVLKGERIATLEIAVDGEQVTDYEEIINNDTIMIQADVLSVGKRVKVQFAQQDYCEVNLYNSEGLTVLPFTKEQ